MEKRRHSGEHERRAEEAGFARDQIVHMRGETHTRRQIERESCEAGEARGGDCACECACVLQKEKPEKRGYNRHQRKK